MPFNRLYENQLIELFTSMQAFNKLAVLNLGGTSGPGGGSGLPPGGIVGQLAQSRVTYDTTEDATMYTPPSGASLVDNLNHIRGRITVIEDEEIVHQSILTFPGNLVTGSNPLRVYNKLGTTQTIDEVFLAVDTVSVGSGIIVDVNVDGTTIFTTQGNRPTIAVGAHTGYSTSIDAPTWDVDEYITADIDQVGSSTAGSDLVVHIVHHGHRP